MIGLIITIVDKKMPFYLFDVLILLNLMINIIIPSPGFKIFNLKFEGEYSKIKILLSDMKIKVKQSDFDTVMSLPKAPRLLPKKPNMFLKQSSPITLLFPFIK